MSEEEQNRREQALRDCLERLPRKSKQVLLMRYDDSGSGIDQIAKRLGRSMAATYGVLKRLRMSLRSCVERRLSAEVQHEQSTK